MFLVLNVIGNQFTVTYIIMFTQRVTDTHTYLQLTERT